MYLRAPCMGEEESSKHFAELIRSAASRHYYAVYPCHMMVRATIEEAKSAQLRVKRKPCKRGGLPVFVWHVESMCLKALLVGTLVRLAAAEWNKLRGSSHFSGHDVAGEHGRCSKDPCHVGDLPSRMCVVENMCMRAIRGLVIAAAVGREGGGGGNSAVVCKAWRCSRAGKLQQ
jgi:hypothetical protein